MVFIDWFLLIVLVSFNYTRGLYVDTERTKEDAQKAGMKNYNCIENTF